MNNNLESKYGDDEKHEPWTDINIFFPIASKLVDPLYNLGLTPNMITILSTIFTFLSIYFLHLDKRIHAVVSYIIGYILDCVDGKMARKYNMGSDFGMVLDTTSDNISHAFLILYILITKKFTFKNIIIILSILLLIYMYSINNGLNEAISSYNATGSDNFYERRKKQLKGEACGIKKLLYDIFLINNKFCYQTYRRCFKTFDKDKIDSKLKILKQFGPGNIILGVAVSLILI